MLEEITMAGTAVLAAGPDRESVNAFLDKMQSPDADVRYAAWKSAGPMGSMAVVGLGDLAANSDKAITKAARGALLNVAHYAARPGAAAEAHAVSIELLKLAAAPERPRAVRADALNLLGFTADSRTVPGIARLLSDTEMRDEARMALERIPGSAATNALRKAAQSAPADFRPNLDQSLSNRSLTPKTVGIKT